MDDLKITMLEQKIEDFEKAAQQQKSQLLTLFLDLKVMLENEEVEEALEMLNELTED